MAAVGALVTAGCALGGLLVWDGSGARRELLVAARAIPAGHVVEAADLRPVAVGGAEGVSAVVAQDAARLVGRAATVPVAAGALIPADLTAGAGVLPPPGQVVLSVALAAGAVPPQAGPGATVRVLPVPASGRPAVASPGWDAVLLGVEPSRSGEALVIVSLQVDEADAAGLAATGADVTVVVLAGVR